MVSKVPAAPAAYMLARYVRMGTQQGFLGSEMPAATISAPGSAALIRGAAAFAIATYWEAFGPSGQNLGMLGSFQSWNRRTGSFGTLGLAAQKLPLGP